METVQNGIETDEYGMETGERNGDRIVWKWKTKENGMETGEQRGEWNEDIRN